MPLSAARALLTDQKCLLGKAQRAGNRDRDRAAAGSFASGVASLALRPQGLSAFSPGRAAHASARSQGSADPLRRALAALPAVCSHRSSQGPGIVWEAEVWSEWVRTAAGARGGRPGRDQVKRASSVGGRSSRRSCPRGGEGRTRRRGTGRGCSLHRGRLEANSGGLGAKVGRLAPA